MIHQSCRQGFRLRYLYLPLLLEGFRIRHGYRSFWCYLNALAKMDLVILSDRGLPSWVQRIFGIYWK